MPPLNAMRPSAFCGPCQTRSHFAPAAITPAMAVTVASRGGAGTGKALWPLVLRGALRTSRNVVKPMPDFGDIENLVIPPRPFRFDKCARPRDRTGAAQRGG